MPNRVGGWTEWIKKEVKKVLKNDFSKILSSRFSSLGKQLDAEDSRWVLWIPVALGLGIGLYFSLTCEPSKNPWISPGLPIAAGCFLCMGFFINQTLVRFFSWALFWGISGFFLALVRTEQVNPYLLTQSTGPIWTSGIVESIDHPASSTCLFQRIALRLDPLCPARSENYDSFVGPTDGNDLNHPMNGKTKTELKQRIEERMGKKMGKDIKDDHSWAAQNAGRNSIDSANIKHNAFCHEKTKPLLPKKAMITIRTACAPLLEGDHIRLKVILNPLPGPCFPGAHDPRRQFFFQGIGASGFALTSPRIVSRNPKILARWRHTLTRKIHGFLPPPLGAIGCGLVTGDKIALPQNIRQEFSDSGLAHLLAIAGLHISILSGLCFMVFQRSLARIPSLALYVNLDRVAAFLSLCVGWVYLMISGQRYPVQRAFFMMAATMLGMLAGRRRHSMRILMLCAATFLILQPESLLSLSFQLSFAAVGGLIAVYEWRMQWRYRPGWRPWKRKKYRHIKRFVADSFWSTGSITLMTLPIMIHHFYHVSLQGFLSNMIAIPFTAAAIMPLGIVALVSMATPWAGPMMMVWGWSLRGLMGIAGLSARYGAWMIGWIRPHNSLFFALEMLGIGWMLLWQNLWRWWGAVVWVMASLLGHSFRTQPSFLIDSHHKLVAYVDNPHSTLWVSSLRRGKWAAQRWSQAFGVHHVRLWPTEKSHCIAMGLPWYAMIGDKGAKDWSLDLGLNEKCFLSGKGLGPQTGCQMLDQDGQNMERWTSHRPWNP